MAGLEGNHEMKREGEWYYGKIDIAASLCGGVPPNPSPSLWSLWFRAGESSAGSGDDLGLTAGL
jgi:hypothetical protein